MRSASEIKAVLIWRLPLEAKLHDNVAQCLFDVYKHYFWHRRHKIDATMKDPFLFFTICSFIIYTMQDKSMMQIATYHIYFSFHSIII